MSLADYIATLQKTKTYQAGLISLQEYSFQKRWFVPTLPKLPSADDDRHVVVVEIRGNQPNIRTVLKEPGHTFHATTMDADKLMFIFVEMRPHTLVIQSPAEGYRMRDGYRIDAKFTVRYQVEDAKIFWRESRDQLADFEMSITDAARTFFLGRSSDSLIGCPAGFKQSVEQHISEHETDTSIVKNDIEKSIYTKYKTCTVAGINLLKVFAEIYIGDYLHGCLERIRDKIYEGGGAAEYRSVDQIIDSDDITFAPHKLREVINALDMRLNDNFHTMKWRDAMSKVTEKLAEMKKEYKKSLEQKELEKMQELIKIAVNSGLDKADIDAMKFKLGNKLEKLMDNNTDSHPFSDAEFLRIIIPPDRQLESDTKKT